jgi:hypothetical protein
MRTVAVGAPAPVVSQQPQNAQGTMMLPDSQGVVAYNQERAKQARAELGDRGPAPAGALFWLAWIVLGVGAGLGVHYYLAQRALQ